MIKGLINKKEYGDFLRKIKERIKSSQYEALRKVNKELIQLYWDIGKMIVQRQEQFGWGKSVVQKLSKDMQLEFPGIKGFSMSGLWRMRSFYMTYSKNVKLAQLVREIGWSHNLAIFEKCNIVSSRFALLSMTGVALYVLAMTRPSP